ncbi:NUDIX hydrolase [Paracoccus beibuensis]|uniref:NUDIX hydrolase n=1 Tax=Paracoccus beibuensis TaxID=547602 RepID=UPI00224084E2|nr:NUDIX hydrolase [Paracoccus beibuensis]
MMLGRRPTAMQVGAICRKTATGQVLLVTSRDTGRWVIPKGWPMKGRSLAGAAAQEAWEEAGIRGNVEAQELGRFDYEKGQDAGFSVPVEVRVFALDVEDEADEFPERSQRKRQWFDPADAATLVVEPGLKRILIGLRDHAAH